jgi:hypothetical protein
VQVLDAWEAGEGRHPLEQALVVLGAAEPGASWDELVALDVAERERRLLEIHERTLGPRLDCAATCPACGEQLEFALDTRALDAAAAPTGALEAGGVRFRLPDSSDLALASACADPEEGRRVLAERCALDASGPLQERAVAAMAERMGTVAGAADTVVALACPACGEGWSALLDLPSFLWAEVAAAARRLMAEVDALARAYGWTEDAVLALPARRRRDYVEMAIR